MQNVFRVDFSHCVFVNGCAAAHCRTHCIRTLECSLSIVLLKAYAIFLARVFLERMLVAFGGV